MCIIVVCAAMFSKIYVLCLAPLGLALLSRMRVPVRLWPINLRLWLFYCSIGQGYLMKQKRFTARWQSYFFQMEDGFLKHYDKKSLVGTRKSKVMYGWSVSCICSFAIGVFFFFFVTLSNSPIWACRPGHHNYCHTQDGIRKTSMRRKCKGVLVSYR